jgi:hypothetical protein
MPALVKQVLSGAVTVYRGAHRDLLDVRHMRHALDRLLALGVSGRVVNVASGVPEPVERIVTGIERRLETNARWTFVDVGEGRAVVSIARLRSLVPEVDDLAFGENYLSRLLDRYLAATTGRGSALARRGARPLSPS